MDVYGVQCQARLNMLDICSGGSGCSVTKRVGHTELDSLGRLSYVYIVRALTL